MVSAAPTRMERRAGGSASAKPRTAAPDPAPGPAPRSQNPRGRLDVDEYALAELEVPPRLGSTLERLRSMTIGQPCGLSSRDLLALPASARGSVQDMRPRSRFTG